MTTPTSPELRLHDLRVIKVLGNGAMGTVFLVHNLLSDPSALNPFALKVVEKSDVHSDRRARWEVAVLRRLTEETNPFLPSLIGSLETGEILAWAIPFCPGGDLNVRRYRQSDGVFSPAVIRFYLAEIVCALEHLHSMGLVYRDLKPENVLIRSSGHVTLTDFDLSRALAAKTLQSLILEADPPEKKRVGLKKTKSARVSPVTRRNASFSSGERSNSFVGTEEYVAPEIVRGDGHEFAVDWWALGVLAYEMLYGTTPFRGKNRKDTFGRILMAPPNFTGKPTPLTELITELLQKDPTRRLGYLRGAREIKHHPFFHGLRWEMLTDVVRPPFIPSREDVDLTAGGINITEYFQKSREVPSPFGSPSREDRRYNISLTEF